MLIQDKTYFVLQSNNPFLRSRGRRPAPLGFDDAYDDILRVVGTGMQWRSLRPTAAVAYITVFETTHKWFDAGLFRTAYERLLRPYRRRRRPRYCCVDSTFVKHIYGADCVGRNPTDQGRMATKLSAAVDDAGVRMRLLQPRLAAAILPHSNWNTTLHRKGLRFFHPTLDAIGASRTRGSLIFFFSFVRCNDYNSFRHLHRL